MRLTDEQRIEWGAELCKRLEGAKSLHAIVGERIAKQQELDAALKASMERAGREATEETDALRALTEASEDAARRARLVAVKLEAAHLEGSIEADVYQKVIGASFPQGTGSIGAMPGDRFQALRRIAAALEAIPEGVGAELGKLAADAAATLQTANDRAKKEAAERQAAHDDLGQARARWDDGWLATKEILSGLLRDAGRRQELPDYFPDMR